MKTYKKIGLDVDNCFDLTKYLDYIKERKEQKNERKRNIKRNGRKSKR